MAFYQLFHLILHEIDRFGCFMLKSGFFSKSLVLCLSQVWKDSNIPSPIKRLDHHKANDINWLNPYCMPCFMKTDDYKSGSERTYCTLSLWNSPGLFSRHLIQYAFVVYVIQDYTINGIKLKVWLCRTKRSAIQWVYINIMWVS